jgi:hypothetical protein
MSLSYLPHSVRKLELRSIKDFKPLGLARTLGICLDYGYLILQEGSMGDILPEKEVHLNITVDFWIVDPTAPMAESLYTYSNWNDYHIDHLVITPLRAERSILFFTSKKEDIDSLMFICPRGRDYEIKAFTPPRENFRRG